MIEDEELGQVIQLQGDHRMAVQTFMIDNKVVKKKEEIKVHGF